MEKVLLDICNKLEIDTKKIKNDVDAVRMIIRHCNNLSSPTVDDYGNIISCLFRIFPFCHWDAIDPSLTELGRYQQKSYKEIYFETIFSALRRAGSNSMGKMNKSKLMEKVENNSRYITKEAFLEILRIADQRRNHSFGIDLKYSVIYGIIQNMKISTEDKVILKFRYIDAMIIGSIAYTKINSIIKKYYPKYRFDNRMHCSPETINALSEENGYGRLYIKSTETGNSLSLYLANSDAITLECNEIICGINIMYIADRHKIRIQSKGGQVTQNTITVQYSSQYDDKIQFYQQYAMEIEKLLLQNFDIMENLDTVGFEMIYLYAEKVHDLEPQEIVFSSALKIRLDREIQKIYISAVEDKKERPNDFYGPEIGSIHALIGKNGSGKSSIFDIISNCPMFTGNNQKTCGNYFLIYRMGNHFYYSSWGVDFEIINKQQAPLLEYEKDGDMTLVKISNVFDAFEYSRNRSIWRKDEENSLLAYDSTLLDETQVIDLTTDSLMNDAGSFQSYFECEMVRYMNYAKVFQKSRNNCREDEFQIKYIQDGKEYLSSGERARLSLFSRLLSVFYIDSKYKLDLESFQPTSNYLVMLDEAELYFHPAWQRTLILDLCKFIHKIKEKKLCSFDNITIILSSNSPFYLSDLPADAIHTLGGGESLPVSFGQNIYGLLENNFFMKDGVIGAFAQSKLEAAFKFLDDDCVAIEKRRTGQKLESFENQKEEIAKIEYLVSILGDPLLKQILIDQLREIKGEWKEV